MAVPIVIKKIDTRTLPTESAYLKRLEDCATSEEFYKAIDTAVAYGEFGNNRNTMQISKYMVRAFIYNPRRIAEYIESGTDPDTAWEIELERGPDTGHDCYTVASPVRLESAHRRMRVRAVVMEEIMKGTLDPGDVYRDIHPTHPDIDMLDIQSVFDLLRSDGILT